jgi:3-oxoacyl-[acyl-carrier protein] reductase
VDDLTGRVAVVTGVSRRAGIGFAVARRLLVQGATVVCQSWAPHDAGQPWGADPLGADGVVAALGAPAGRVDHLSLDLGDAGAARRLVDRAVERCGRLDILVAAHARSSSQSLADMTADELDRCWAVNARASALLVQAFAERHDGGPGRPGGRIVLFTSGQHRGPMPGELPYAISKGAIHQMTLSLADALADRGIGLTTVDPGPTDTGWAPPDLAAELARAFPRGRWTTPDEIAALVAWLVGEDAFAVTGTVMNAEAGFRRHAP